jgi:hypothetical protein
MDSLEIVKFLVKKEILCQWKIITSKEKQDGSTSLGKLARFVVTKI